MIGQLGQSRFRMLREIRETEADVPRARSGLACRIHPGFLTKSSSSTQALVISSLLSSFAFLLATAALSLPLRRLVRLPIRFGFSSWAHEKLSVHLLSFISRSTGYFLQ